MEFFTNHIEGSDNGFADILTRLCKSYHCSVAEVNRLGALSKEITTTAEEVTPLSIDKIKQHQPKQQHPVETKVDEDQICVREQQIWVLSEAKDLNLRIVVDAHCGERDQRAHDATMELIQRT